MEPLQILTPCRSMSPRVPRSLSGSGIKTKSVLENSRSERENTPPSHPNVQTDRSSLASVPKKSLNQMIVPFAVENPNFVDGKDGSAPLSDDSVKVVVRIRPDQEKGGRRIVQRTGSKTLLVGDQTYSFDSILDSESSQEDVFNLIGVPLVKNSLAGFNNSIISYGQSGTGKTYTMWGPPSAMVDGACISSSQGIVPRIFHMLFSEITKKEKRSEEVQTNYQFRCSFLEIHNEQFSDLLDPTPRNLMMWDDARNAFQVENLSEEYVNTIEDVTQLLVKGLSNRKVGTTSVNSKSSRSHIIFTCVIESWCKGLSSKSFSSSKTSTINFVDLAGIGNDNLDGPRRQNIQEERFIKKSLSKLGRMINILSDSTRLDNDEKIPQVDSCLTTILQNTLGGNAKVTFICAIFPDERYKTITLSTLRFGSRAKQMRNKAMINEISEDDVNDLSDQIRHLKEELIKAKSCGNSCSISTGGYFKSHNTRESLNQLRRNLNRSLLLPVVDNDPEVDMDVDEEDVRELWVQLDELNSSVEEQAEDFKTESRCTLSSDMLETDLDKSVNRQTSIIDPEPDKCSFLENSEIKEECSEAIELKKPNIITAMESNQTQNSSEISSLCKQLLQLEEPVFCSSPKVDNGLSKSSNSFESPKFSVPEKELVNKVDPIRSSIQSNKVSPIESLAASLHRGLQIIDYHQQNSAINKSPVVLSFQHLSSFSCQTGMKKEDNAPFLCSACKKQMPAAMEFNQVLESGINASEVLQQKNSELEALCAEQAEKIKDLDSQIDQYKHVCEQSLSSEHDSSVAVEMKKDDKPSLAIENEKSEKEALLDEIQRLRMQLNSYSCNSMNVSLLEQVRNGGTQLKGEEFEREKEKWMESESRWISLTEELSMDLESNRRLVEKKVHELSLEKQCTAELDDALHRSIQSHARMIEHYAELQEKYAELLAKHRKVMEGIAEVKKAAEKAGSKRNGSAFAAALAAELATSRVEREKERTYLKEQNRVLKIQLRDTAEAVHAAGELLVRLKEAEEAVSVTEDKNVQAVQEIERLKRQTEKMKKKHTMEIATMKHYLAGSRLPESALEPLYLAGNRLPESALEQPSVYHHVSESADRCKAPLTDDMSWRSAFRPCISNLSEE